MLSQLNNHIVQNVSDIKRRLEQLVYIFLEITTIITR